MKEAKKAKEAKQIRELSQIMQKLSSENRDLVISHALIILQAQNNGKGNK